MGRGLNLSTLVVFMSLVVTGALCLGPVGMLLSVPLTVTAKSPLEGFPETRGLALLLGADIPEAQGRERIDWRTFVTVRSLSGLENRTGRERTRFAS